MPDRSFRVDQIDHVEFFVPDRYEAAAWYEKVLGLEIVKDFEHWGKSARGPLMISSDGGSTKLALFEGESQGERPTAGFHLVAFRVGAKAFVDFLRGANEYGLESPQGEPVTARSAVDHGKAYSIYFKDPYGHRLEITTYDYDATSGLLAKIEEEGTK